MPPSGVNDECTQMDMPSLSLSCSRFSHSISRTNTRSANPRQLFASQHIYNTPTPHLGLHHHPTRVFICYVTDNAGIEAKITVVAKHRPTELPTPGKIVGRKILDTLREMTHIDADKGSTALALGIRDSSIDLKVKVKDKSGGEKITVVFPKEKIMR